ncbi:MAG: hypothetical protein WC781_03155 [Candidatus Pacearchaeota archaeon]|jgi:hypothetical protein
MNSEQKSRLIKGISKAAEDIRAGKEDRTAIICMNNYFIQHLREVEKAQEYEVAKENSLYH